MPEPVIQVHDLTKHFNGLTAVDHLSFNVYRGEVFGFLGPNGAGKSTTINMLCGLTKPSSGTISFKNPPGDDNPGTLIGLCPQENIHWSKLTCLEQLIFVARCYNIPGSSAKKKATVLLTDMGLEAKRDVQAAKLSGGMKRRLNLCLALVHDPGIIVLDEPEAGLDPQSRIMVREYIRSLAENKTVILTTHNMDEAERLSHRVAIIDKGKLLLTGSPDELKNTIGEGDTLEIILEGSLPSGFDSREFENPGWGKLRISENCLFITSKNIVNEIGRISSILKDKNLRVKEMKIRQNTLEDVFIHLTGKNLRS